MRTAPHRKGSESGGRASSRYRGVPDRIATNFRHTPKLVMLSGDAILGAVIALGALFIALVWYDGTPRYNPELASEAESLIVARDILAKSTALNWSAEVPIEVWDGVAVDPQTMRVTGLRLRDSELDGMIPQELGILTDLTYLDLRGNQLTGTIPAELGKLVKLEILYLHNNRLSGNMPAELGDLSNLQRLWLSNNQLTGSIPPELGRLSVLEELNLRANRLSGAIPTELGELMNLRRWRLAGNQFTGCIPTALAVVETSDLGQLSIEPCTGS